MKTVRRPPYPKWNPGYFPCSSLTPLPLSSRRPSVSFGGFGFRGVRLYSSPLPHIRWHICYHMFESHILILWMVDGLYFVGSQ